MLLGLAALSGAYAVCSDFSYPRRLGAQRRRGAKTALAFVFASRFPPTSRAYLRARRCLVRSAATHLPQPRLRSRLGQQAVLLRPAFEGPGFVANPSNAYLGRGAGRKELVVDFLPAPGGSVI